MKKSIIWYSLIGVCILVGGCILLSFFNQTKSSVELKDTEGKALEGYVSIERDFSPAHKFFLSFVDPITVFYFKDREVSSFLVKGQAFISQPKDGDRLILHANLEENPSIFEFEGESYTINPNEIVGIEQVPKESEDRKSAVFIFELKSGNLIFREARRPWTRGQVLRCEGMQHVGAVNTR